MGRTIEAKVVISGEDRGLSKTIDGIHKKIRDFDRNAKTATNVAKLGKDIDAANRSLKDMERFRGVQSNFAHARAGFRAAQNEVGRLGRELDAARKAAAAFDGIKSFSKAGGIAQEIAAARKQVGALEREFAQAQRAVKAASSAYETQATALKGVKRELESGGATIGRLVGEQGRLKAAIEGTNAALARQERLARAEGGLAAGMGQHGRRELARIDQSRRLTEGMSAAGKAAAPTAGTIAGGAPGAGPIGWGPGAIDAATGLGVGIALKGAYGRARDGWLEMDEATRRQKAVLGLDDAKQGPLYKQAVKIGVRVR